MNPERWGVLGGVFDPIHYAHLAIAEQTREALDLDRVVFVPTGVPVHRPPAIASPEDRAAMVELAIADNDRFGLSRVEIDSDAPGYTLDTVRRLAAERASSSYVVILSSESASYLTEWHEPTQLIDLAEIAVVPRLGYANLSREWLAANFPGRADRFLFVETSHLGHSSSDVRGRIAAGRSVRYLVPPAVEAYISEHQLYRQDDRPTA